MLFAIFRHVNVTLDKICKNNSFVANTQKRSISEYCTAQIIMLSYKYI